MRRAASSIWVQLCQTAGLCYIPMNDSSVSRLVTTECGTGGQRSYQTHHPPI